ncbi:MAG: nuclease-related domain-containing protein [Methanobacterium sp.]
MPYLICNKCEIYYEIDDDFDINHLKSCEKCGEKLKYYKDLDDFYRELETSNDISKLDDEKTREKSTYNLFAISGLIIAIIGLGLLLLAYISPFIFIAQSMDSLNSTSSFNANFAILSQVLTVYILSFIFMVGGVIIYVYGERKGHYLKKSSGGISKVQSYLTELPESYFILNKVKIPHKKINFEQIVIGPTGIFLIKLKSLKGNYIIEENKLFNEKSTKNNRIIKNEGINLKRESIEVKRFLTSKGMDINHLMINTILAFQNNNFKIRKKPSFYDVLYLENISDFILNSKRKMDERDIIEAMIILEPYSKEVLKRK